MLFEAIVKGVRGWQSLAAVEAKPTALKQTLGHWPLERAQDFPFYYCQPGISLGILSQRPREAVL